MRRDAEEHRARLVAAAARVFVRQGCGVPLETVLVEAGVGRGTLYRHFKTRADLVLAVLRDELERSMAFVRARRHSKSLLREFLADFAQIGMMAASAMETFGDEDALVLMRPLQERAGALFDLVIQDALSSGEVAPPFDEGELLLLMRMVIAAASQEKTEEGRRRLIDRALVIVFDGVGAA